MRSRSERREGFGPEESSFGVRALVVTDITCSACAESAFVSHHGVMPGGHASAERCLFVLAEAGTEHQIWIHVTPTLSRGTRASHVQQQLGTLHHKGIPVRAPLVRVF